jgi:hypothetical protein
MAGINLDMVTNTRDIKKGFKDVESALEDVADSLDDVAKDGENATEDLEKSFKDLARDTKKEARDMGRDVSKSYDKMADGAGEATDQMKEDSFSNAKEVAASFDGSAESIVDGFQGAAAEMFSGFGPAGAAAGLAAAAGLGLITAEMTRQKEEAAAAAEATWTMAQEMVEAGIYMVTENQKIEAFEALVGDQEQRDKFKTQLDTLGITWTDFVAAQVGLGEKREEVETRIRGYYDDQISALGDIGTFDEERQRIAGSLVAEQERLLDPIRQQAEIQDEAVRTAEDIRRTYMDAGVELENNVDVASELRREAAMISRQDATPKFDMTPAFNELSRFQQELNRLRVPDLNVNITRTIR